MSFRIFTTSLLVFAVGVSSFVGTKTLACPFCNAVSQTLRQEMAVMDAVVIATAVDRESARNEETGEVLMKIEKVLKGDTLVKVGQEVNAIYYGDVKAGRSFMLSGVDPPKMQWSCLPLSERAEDYVVKLTQLPDDDLTRLRFYYRFLQDEETMLSRDAYDEFATTPYPVIKALAPEIDHAALVSWINDPEATVERRRLYLTLLGVCGDEKDLPMLEAQLRSTQKSSRSGLDALVACYLTLSGEKGLPVIDELFLKNSKAPYADTYAAIMAIRFHGTEGEVIDRSALVESLHHVLDRKDLADLVIPDLARWSDWSQVDKMKQLFIEADADNNWVRVPVVNYLRACPLPEADAALKELEKVDPESVKRANTFFAIPVPAKDTTGSSSSVIRKSKDRDYAVLGPNAGDSSSRDRGSLAGATAANSPVLAASFAARTGAVPANPWRLAYVVSLALSTIMIGQFLLLSGGPAAVMIPVEGPK
ncbi:hypothetical protein Pla52o_43440 [Novipirellula galeiformis]|uniref:Uncharacterized protein n=1 Tax=Novipirellula galeiformis TaxID=2528004 RepID=A0A5C6CAR0_9BACT|nr:hypothetical protein [Novipirellula galeiformis]TWU20466.1 hypothetical protein Pla52o_43440 [Novipirellula galeiformis]